MAHLSIQQPDIEFGSGIKGKINSIHINEERDLEGGLFPVPKFEVNMSYEPDEEYNFNEVSENICISFPSTATGFRKVDRFKGDKMPLVKPLKTVLNKRKGTRFIESLSIPYKWTNSKWQMFGNVRPMDISEEEINLSIALHSEVSMTV